MGIRGLLARTSFRPVESEYRALYSRYKGQKNRGSVRHALNGPFSMHEAKHALGIEDMILPVSKGLPRSYRNRPTTPALFECSSPGSGSLARSLLLSQLHLHQTTTDILARTNPLEIFRPRRGSNPPPPPPLILFCPLERLASPRLATSRQAVAG